MGQIEDIGLVSPRCKKGVDTILLCNRKDISNLISNGKSVIV
jgi:hypothetical protein